MIAGHGTHADQLAREAKPTYRICTDESFNLVQRMPTPAEREVVDAYQHRYLDHFTHRPYGLHYLQLAGELAAVYFPLPE